MSYPPNEGMEFERTKRMMGWTDAFGNQIALGTTNEADLGGHYSYSPERYRVEINGDRQQIQYNGNPSQFDDADDGFVLAPERKSGLCQTVILPL